MKKFVIEPPADVPKQAQEDYIKNYRTITKNSGRLMLFACDQKIEHLNYDFYPTNEKALVTPEHLFDIASKGTIGAMATQLGLIARYGNDYKDINYIVKMNSKTNLIKTKQRDPVSLQLWSVDDVMRLKLESGLNICGIGYTVYLGSEYEDVMLSQAAQIIFHAHQFGLITILWMYPRGKSIKDDTDPELIAGAAGIANALGSDFVKIKPPKKTTEKTSAQWLKMAVAAAGNTKIICSGGKAKDKKEFLKELHDQIHIGGTAGNATGRNIFKHDRDEAITITKDIAKIVFNGQ